MERTNQNFLREKCNNQCTQDEKNQARHRVLPFWLKWPYSVQRSSRVVPRAVAPFRSLLLLFQGGRFLHTFHSMDANMVTIRIGSPRTHIHSAIAPRGGVLVLLSV